MKRVKLEEILKSGSCYSEDKIRGLVGKRKSISLKNLMDMDIQDADKIWAFSHLSFVEDREKRLFSCACAESILHFYEAKYPGDNRPRQAIEVARRYAAGEATIEVLSAAATAAWEAAGAAIAAAAWEAWAAAGAATVAEKWAAARAEQVALIRRFLETGRWYRLAGGDNV